MISNTICCLLELQYYEVLDGHRTTKLKVNHKVNPIFFHRWGQRCCDLPVITKPTFSCVFFTFHSASNLNNKIMAPRCTIVTSLLLVEHCFSHDNYLLMFFYTQVQSKWSLHPHLTILKRLSCTISLTKSLPTPSWQLNAVSVGIKLQGSTMEFMLVKDAR